MKTYKFDIVDADDGSGDAILNLDDEFIKDNDWRTGDTLHLSTEGDSLVIRNIDWQKRNESLPG